MLHIYIVRNGCLVLFVVVDAECALKFGSHLVGVKKSLHIMIVHRHYLRIALRVEFFVDHAVIEPFSRTVEIGVVSNLLGEIAHGVIASHLVERTH